jgi:N-glycosidase YbiA
MDDVMEFKDEFRFLSNFWITPVHLDGIEYPSVEHAYQAAKSLDPDMREFIRLQPTPGKAKKAAFLLPVRPDWTDVNLQIMYDLLREKFSREPLRTQLLDTVDAKLVEGNNWGDKHWGKVFEDGHWVGANHLGDLLMTIREELRGN